jgi:RNA recognition motif-containing protein
MNIYVGNLPYETTGDDLRDFFAPYGTIESASVIQDKVTGKSKGFGFVTMPIQAEADEAIANLNGKPLNGRKLRINQANPKREGDDRRSFNRRDNAY